MAAVTSINYGAGWGSSFSGTLNLPQQMPIAVAQVALNETWTPILNDSTTPDYCWVFITGYSANGNPVTLDAREAVLTVYNANSFSYEGSSSPNGYAYASITAYCFE